MTFPKEIQNQMESMIKGKVESALSEIKEEVEKIRKQASGAITKTDTWFDQITGKWSLVVLVVGCGIAFAIGYFLGSN